MQPDTVILLEDFKAHVRQLPEEEQDAVFHELDQWLDELEGDAETDDDDELDDDATALAPADSEGGTE